MYRENNLYLFVRAMNHLEKQKVIHGFEWMRKRSYLRREKAVNCGKKKQDLSPVREIIFRSLDQPDLFLIGI